MIVTYGLTQNLDDIEESVGEIESSPDRPLAIVTQGMHQVKPKIISFSKS